MKLAAIGSNCIDYYKNLEGGKSFPGGGPVNMAVYTVRIGGEASYIGPVGNDANGEIMKHGIKEKGVDVSHLHVLEGKTALSEVTLVDGEREFGDYFEGVLEHYTLSDEDTAFIQNHDVAVCDLWGKVEGYFEKIRKLGVKTAFDCATRPEDEACQTAIPHTDYLFFSSDDGDTESLRRYMMGLASRGPELVIAMLGEEGSLCYDGEDFTKFGIVPCEKAVDTMGAGDSYIAGFLYGLTNGCSLSESMKLGAQTAADTIAYFGAW